MIVRGFPASGPLRGTAGQDGSISQPFFQPSGTRRRALSGAAGVHRTREYGGSIPTIDSKKEAIFMGNAHERAFAPEP